MAPTWIHLTARLPRFAPDLCGPETGSWLWTHLREAFPEAIASSLMPDHPHVLHASPDPTASTQRLARLLGQFGRRFAVGGSVSRGVSAAIIRGGDVLARQVRYIALNPCRAGLARCPLEWPWSTHRDVVGASVDPWVSATQLASVLGSSPRGFIARHHAYVSGDPHARLDGTPLPTPAASTSIPVVSLRTIARAAAAATRRRVADIRRRGEVRALFVALAFDQGWDHLGKLAEICMCEPPAIRKLARNVDELALRAARLCLGDARLRRGPAITPSP